MQIPIILQITDYTKSKILSLSNTDFATSKKPILNNFTQPVLI